MSASEPTHASYLAYQRGRYLKWALGFAATSVAVYVVDQPLEGSSGSTALGYGLGSVGAALILWLTWLGVRKRQYQQPGRLKGWVSAHVYLGLSLLVVGTLHSGFQFGWNIHTLAWVLMVVVIASGIVGVLCYSVFPRALMRLPHSGTRQQQLAEIIELNQRAMSLADTIEPEIHRQVVRSCEKMRIGGTLWQQLRGPRPASVSLIHQLQGALSGSDDPLAGRPADGTMAFMASQVLKTSGSQRNKLLRQLVDVLALRDQKVWRLNREITLNTRMRAWLLLHVPLSVALLAALIGHVLIVFMYW